MTVRERYEAWPGGHFTGWPPVVGVYQPPSLPAEFRRENKDLRIPRKEGEEMERVENYFLFHPFF